MTTFWIKLKRQNQKRLRVADIKFVAASKVKQFEAEAASGDRAAAETVAMIQNDPSLVVVNDAYIKGNQSSDFESCFLRPERYQIIYGGTSAGKSDAKATDLLIKCMTSDYFRCVYTRKLMTDIKLSQHKLFTDIIARQGWKPYFKVNNLPMSITCIKGIGKGNEMYGIGLDDPDRLKSIAGISDVWVEEPLSATGRHSSSITQKDFEEIDRRLRGRAFDQHIHFTFNPISVNSWIYKEFFEDKKYLDATYRLKTTFKDNEYIDKQAEFAKLMRQGDYLYSIFGLGNWGFPRPDLPWFHEFSMDRHIGVFNKDGFNFDPQKPIIFTFDFNIGIMAGSVWQVDRGKMWCLYEFPKCVGFEQRMESIVKCPYFPYINSAYFTGDATAGQNYMSPGMTFYTAMQKRFNIPASRMRVASYNYQHTDSRHLMEVIMTKADFRVEHTCNNTITDLQLTPVFGYDKIDKGGHDPHWGDALRYVAQNFQKEIGVQLK